MDAIALRPPRGPEDSRAALRAALDWYVRLPAGWHAPAFPPVVVDHLRRALDAPATWQPLFFDVLLALLPVIRASARDAAPPSCTLGDLLTTLASTTPAAAKPWAWEPVVDADVLTKLEVAETSAGIITNHRDNREGWWAHAERTRGFIREAVRLCERHDTAVLLGAAQTFDLPLRELLETFGRVRLVDIDGAALEATARASNVTPKLRQRLDLEVADLTGINRRLLSSVDAIVGEAVDADAARAELATLCRSYHLGAGPRLTPPGVRADLLVSSCLLSQIAWSQARYARNVYERRFGRLAARDADVWALPWRELEIRIQQDHINALPAHGDVAVLTSDVAVRPTVSDGAGGERLAGARRTLLLSTPTLRERVPCFIEVARHAAWEWRLLSPTQHLAGRRYDVEALALRLRTGLPPAGAGATG